MGRAVGRTSSTGVPVQHREHRSWAIPRPQQVFASALLRQVSLLSRLATITFALHSSPTLFDWSECQRTTAARRRCLLRSFRFSCHHFNHFLRAQQEIEKRKAVGIQKTASPGHQRVGCLLLTKKKVNAGFVHRGLVAGGRRGRCADRPSAGCSTLLVPRLTLGCCLGLAGHDQGLNGGIGLWCSARRS